MPATLKSFPSLYKFTALPKSQIIAQKAYSTLPRKNSGGCLGKHLTPTSTTLTPITLRYYNSNSKTTDRQLHESFNGLLPRFLSLQNLLQQEGRKTFSELFLNDVIITEQLFTGIKLYTDLQNPLLNKYSFNIQEFFIGVKEAYIQIQKSITVLHLMNNDLMKERKENYQLYDIHIGLLNLSLNKHLYKIIEKQLQKPINPVSPAFADYIITLNSLTLNSIVIEHVTTQIIDNTNHEDGKYPVGSVLATVDVVFESDQLYEHCEDSSKPKVKRTIASKWSFQGCISGHVPLNWMIVSMKNYIKNSSLQK